MKITGPFLDRQAKDKEKPWYLLVRVMKKNPDGTAVLVNGKIVLRRLRPHYGTQSAAIADIPSLEAQYAVAGASAGGILTRAQVEEYERAKSVVPEASLVDVAQFWRLHHPLTATCRIKDLIPLFLEFIEARLGRTEHWRDLKWRLRAFSAKFAERIPATIQRDDILAYLYGMKKAGRTVLNHKRAICNFFNWLVEKNYLHISPVAGIRQRQLPKIDKKEIRFLDLPFVEAYLRACERYDVDLVAHEIIQFVAGVRADDEMADFRGDWVLPQTKELIVPAEIAKTGRREVILGLEENFWAWWKHYGRKGVLRPDNYQRRWRRIRVLASIGNVREADRFAGIPIKRLLTLPIAKAALPAWPWNARRRTFCSYHVAKHQSADKTALILRHRGSAATLHNSYRGTGITPEQGTAYFEFMPKPVKQPIFPVVAVRGIVLIQRERKRAALAAAAA